MTSRQPPHGRRPRPQYLRRASGDHGSTFGYFRSTTGRGRRGFSHKSPKSPRGPDDGPTRRSSGLKQQSASAGYRQDGLGVGQVRRTTQALRSTRLMASRYRPEDVKWARVIHRPGASPCAGWRPRSRAVGRLSTVSPHRSQPVCLLGGAGSGRGHSPSPPTSDLPPSQRHPAHVRRRGPARRPALRAHRAAQLRARRHRPRHPKQQGRAIRRYTSWRNGTVTTAAYARSSTGRTLLDPARAWEAVGDVRCRRFTLGCLSTGRTQGQDASRHRTLRVTGAANALPFDLHQGDRSVHRADALRRPRPARAGRPPCRARGRATRPHEEPVAHGATPAYAPAASADNCRVSGNCARHAVTSYASGSGTLGPPRQAPNSGIGRMDPECRSAVAWRPAGSARQRRGPLFLRRQERDESCGWISLVAKAIARGERMRRTSNRPDVGQEGRQSSCGTPRQRRGRDPQCCCAWGAAVQGGSSASRRSRSSGCRVAWFRIRRRWGSMSSGEPSTRRARATADAIRASRCGCAIARRRAGPSGRSLPRSVGHRYVVKPDRLLRQLLRIVSVRRVGSFAVVGDPPATVGLADPVSLYKGGGPAAEVATRVRRSPSVGGTRSHTRLRSSASWRPADWSQSTSNMPQAISPILACVAIQ